jgi:hypothetical protein
VEEKRGRGRPKKSDTPGTRKTRSSKYEDDDDDDEVDIMDFGKF